MLTEVAYIGLGSNLNEPVAQITKALKELHQSPNLCVQSCSHLYKSLPMGPQDQPDYTNAVCKIKTSISPFELLELLQAIENNHLRDRQEMRWGPRTLDLDILIFDKQKINHERLIIPHIGIQDREFVLVPLFEIEPDLIMPDGRNIASWVTECDLKGLKRLNTQVDFSSIAA